MVSLPAGAPETWVNVFTDEVLHEAGGQLDLTGILKKFPVALLTGHTG